MEFQICFIIVAFLFGLVQYLGLLRRGGVCFGLLTFVMWADNLRHHMPGSPTLLLFCLPLCITIK